jgi:uncharacterized membrane protein YagU involved in acid resistance
MARRNLIFAILLGGFIAGTVDIGAAALINLISPFVIAQAIASGLLGKASYFDGWQSAALGVLLQCLMSFIIAGVFVIAAQWLSILRSRWIAAGLAYGVVIFVVMSFVVVPLSNAYPRHDHMPPPDKIVENLLAMFVFGLIVSWFAKDTVRRTV